VIGAFDSTFFLVGEVSVYEPHESDNPFVEIDGRHKISSTPPDVTNI